MFKIQCCNTFSTIITILSCCVVINHCVQAQRINIINVAKDVDRWNRVQNEFESQLHQHRKDQEEQQQAQQEAMHDDNVEDEYNYEITIERIDAINGKELSKQELKENATWGARMFCTSGTIGCYLSHRSFWQQVVDDNEPYQVVFEDDVVLVDDFYTKLRSRIQELETAVGVGNWDVLLLGGLGCVNPNKKYGSYNIPAFVSGGCRTPKMVTDSIHIPKRPFGTHAYVLSKRGAAKLLKLAYKATYHVDCVIWGIQELDLYITHPLLVYQDSSPSTVGAITSGIETWIPKGIKMDDYTKMSLEWVWNEAVIRIPGINVIITQGRYLLLGIFGSIIGMFQLQNHPWFLPSYLTVYLVFIVTFNRIINTPVGAQN